MEEIVRESEIWDQQQEQNRIVKSKNVKPNVE